MTTPLPKIAEVLREDANNVSVDQGTCRVCKRPMWSYSDLCPACLLAAADALDAVGRLPRTADGKMVLPGDFVWTFDCANPAGFGFRVLNISETHLDGKEACAEFSKCYSTRALAEAAAKETTDGQA